MRNGRHHFVVMFGSHGINPHFGVSPEFGNLFDGSIGGAFVRGHNEPAPFKQCVKAGFGA